MIVDLVLALPLAATAGFLVATGRFLTGLAVRFALAVAGAAGFSATRFEAAAGAFTEVATGAFFATAFFGAETAALAGASFAFAALLAGAFIGFETAFLLVVFFAVATLRAGVLVEALFDDVRAEAVLDADFDFTFAAVGAFAAVLPDALCF